MPILTEKGIVREIDGSRITIAPDRSAACFGCMNHECKTGNGLLTAENKFGLPIENGQIVEVETEAAALLPQAITALLPPVLGFLTGFILTRLLLPGAGEAVAAFIGLALLFGAARAVYKAKGKKPGETSYTITRII